MTSKTNGKSRLSALAPAALLLAASQSALAQDIVTSPPQDPRTTHDDWNDEHKANAQPMPMPMPEVTGTPSPASPEAIRPCDPPIAVEGNSPGPAGTEPGAEQATP